MTVQILHALAVSFPARLVVQTSVVWFVDATASGCTNSVKGQRRLYRWREGTLVEIVKMKNY